MRTRAPAVRGTNPMEPMLDCYLKTYRRRWGLTQQELASLLGYQTGAVVSRLELAARSPTLETAYAFELILGLAAPEIFPGLHAKVRSDVIARARVYYDELQGGSSRDIRLKLDFLEEVFARADLGRAESTSSTKGT